MWKMFIGASSNAKTCSPECSIALSQQRQRERFHKKYKRKGYNQKGENNNIFKKNPDKKQEKTGFILNIGKIIVNTAVIKIRY